LPLLPPFWPVKPDPRPWVSPLKAAPKLEARAEGRPLLRSAPPAPLGDEDLRNWRRLAAALAGFIPEARAWLMLLAAALAPLGVLPPNPAPKPGKPPRPENPGSSPAVPERSL